MASRGQFCGHKSWLQFPDESAWTWLQFGSQIADISATIGSRSRHDRDAIRPRSWSWSFIDRLPIDWRRLPKERTAIAARSDRDRGFFHVLSAPSDGASGERMATIARSRGLKFRGASAVRWKTIAIATLFVRWGSGAPEGSTRRQGCQRSRPSDDDRCLLALPRVDHLSKIIN